MATDRYKILSMAFFVRRELGLTYEAELELADALGEAWRALSASEREDVRARLPAEAVERFEQKLRPTDASLRQRALSDLVRGWINECPDPGEPDWDPLELERMSFGERLDEDHVVASGQLELDLAASANKIDDLRRRIRDRVSNPKSDRVRIDPPELPLAALDGLVQVWEDDDCERIATPTAEQCRLLLLDLFIQRASGQESYENEMRTTEILAKEWLTSSADTSEDVYVWIDKHKYLPLDELLAIVLSIGGKQ